MPVADYSASVTRTGFATATETLTVISGATAVLHIQLVVATVNESVTVSAQQTIAPTDSPSPVTLVDRQDIARTPGAGLTNSLGMITDFVPGAYITHDMLHMRGGHRPRGCSTACRSSTPAIAGERRPTVRARRHRLSRSRPGGCGTEFGDRTYGVLNVVPRTGFERNNDADVSVSGGNFGQTDDSVSVGGRTVAITLYTSARMVIAATMACRRRSHRSSTMPNTAAADSRRSFSMRAPQISCVS